MRHLKSHLRKAETIAGPILEVAPKRVCATLHGRMGWERTEEKEACSVAREKSEDTDMREK